MEYNFEKHFSDKLKDAKLSPPDELWDDISDNLPEQTDGNASPSILRYGIAAVFAFVLGASSMYFYMNNTSNSESLISSETIEQEQLTYPAIFEKQKQTESDLAKNREEEGVKIVFHQALANSAKIREKRTYPN